MSETRGTLMLCALVLAGCGGAPTTPAALTPNSLARFEKAKPVHAPEVHALRKRGIEDAMDRLLRVHSGDAELTRVLRLSGHVAEPSTPADYEAALLAEATLVPEENLRLPETKPSRCSVGPSELDCLTKTDRVSQAEREPGETALPGREVSAAITAADGSVIYRASSIEHGNVRRTENATVELQRPKRTHPR
jgi:hypothetical protein